MKKYQSIFDESELVTKHDDEVGLPDREYHLHAKDLAEGNIPLEMETLNKIAETLSVDVDLLSERQLFLCYEYIFDCIQIGYKLKEEEQK